MISVFAHRRFARMAFVFCVALALPSSAEQLPVHDESVARALPGRPLLVESKDGINLNVARSSNTDEIVIQTGSSKPLFQISKLSNPPRLVVDIQSHPVRSNRSIAVADLDLVSKVRVGSQAQAARIVMDLTEGVNVTHKVRSDAGTIFLTLNSADDAKKDVVAGSPSVVAAVKPIGAKAKEDERQKTSPQLKRSEPVGITAAEEGDRYAEEETVGSSPIVENAVVPASLGELSQDALRKDNRAAPKQERGIRESNIAQTLSTAAATNLELQKEDSGEAQVVPASMSAKGGEGRIRSVGLGANNERSSSVEIDIEGEPEFSLERTAPSEYVLTVRDTRVSDGALSSTLFSESQTSAIRSARSTVRGRDALVRIFVQPEAYLSARRVNSKIVVEETTDLRKVVDDMRAQLAPKDPKASMDSKAPDTKGVNAERKVDSSKKDGADKMGATDAKSKASGAAAKVEPKPATVGEEEMSQEELQSLLGDTARYTGKLISLDLQDTDIDNALRIIAEVSNLNVVASEDVVGKVTLRLTDVPWDQALDVILKTHGLDKVLEGNVMRIAPIDKLRVERESLKQARAAEAELAPLVVKYLRVSYGKAAELKSLVETVISERGSVAYDERSNQLIVKDIESGIKNVSELVSKVDLRTPQVLLETQIVESNRNLMRELGSELGFQYIQSPSTGNGTGLNFPSAISVGGSNGTAIPGSGTTPVTLSSFPASGAASALTMLFDSADGTRSLEMRLSQLETEGRARIVSRPAVATTNNKAAEIKSVEKYRVKLPNGGTSVATGQGSMANGTGGSATETIEAGIVLNVTPQASPDYYILLDIKAKSSSFGQKTVDGIPNEIERSASSSVLVSSGQTFALGGIYRLRENDDIAGIPFLKDVPIFGTFFRRSTTDHKDEELLFFITPRIVEGSFDDSSMKADS